MIPAIVGAGQRLLARRAAQVELPPGKAPNPALGIFLWSRAAIWLAALFAWLTFEPNHHPHFHRWDRPWLHDSGWFVDVWGRWDSAWLLQVAIHGYDNAKRTAAFFPLYPGLVAGAGRALGSHYVLAGVAVSLTACYGSFLLLQRLAEERLGADGARRAVLYLALFPMSLFLQAAYAESLFLLLTLLAFFFAERGQFGRAGVATGLAILTRAVGVALLPALALIAWRSRDRLRALAGLALAPLSFLAYPLVLWQQGRSPFAFLHAELDPTWARRFSWAGPLGGIWDGARAAFAGVRQLIAGPGGHVYWPVRDTTPMRVAALNLELFAYLVLFVCLTVLVWRRFGSAYGLFCALSLAIPLSVPSHRWPLLSLPRFGLVIFPFFLALAVLGGRPRVHAAIVGVSAILLGIAVAQWATWQWVA
jgi:Mannosyltransferase (PIG-V)